MGGSLASGDGADRASSDSLSHIALHDYPIARALTVLKARALTENPKNYTREAAGQDQRGPKRKARDNIEAIRLIKQCAMEDRFPSDEERQKIALFYGFGGIPQAFPRPNGTVAEGWEDVVPALQEVTTSEEYAAIRRSTLDAHYTADMVVESMWAGVERMGIKAHREPFRIWESSIGSGVFFALMPKALQEANPFLERSAVEMDTISATVSQVLFPEDRIINAPLQSVPMRHPVDLVIGNPPFGSQKLLDMNRRDLSLIAPNTHSYFFAKSINALNEGGIAALVVSRYLLDANREENQEFRRWMHRHAELLHAVRLPRTAFSKTAFTEVVTDILVLRKRAEPLPTDTQDPDWIDGKVPLTAAHNGKPLFANGWYANREDLILGTPSLAGKMYGGPKEEEFTVLPLDDVPLSDLLAERFVAQLPEDGFSQWMSRPSDRIDDGPKLPKIDREQVGRVQPYGYFMVPDAAVAELIETFGKTQSGLRVARRLPDDFEGAFCYTLEEEKNARHFPRLAGMIALRDAAMELLTLQLSTEASEGELSRLRARLNQHYDPFRKEFGCLNSESNERMLRGDPGSAVVMGLEREYDKGVSSAMARKTGENSRKPSAVKSDLFTQRTQYPVRPVETADSAKDALFIVLAESGEVRWNRVCQLTRKSWESVAAELGLETPSALAFENPDGRWEERSAFLSGDVKNRMEAVEQALQGENRVWRRRSLQASLEALQGVIPKPIPAELITVHPGAPYIPESMVEQFLTDTGLLRPSVRFLPYNGQWQMKSAGAGGPEAEKFTVAKRPLYKLVGDLFNHRTPIIYDNFPDGSRAVDEESTALAIEKIKAIREHWHQWLQKDPERMALLADEYNHRFNRIVQREYDGRHLTLAGAAANISLRPHQKNAVWRACQSTSILLDHKVGAGKTFAAIAGVMEKRRMGQARKPVVTVPNHLVGQWAAAWVTLYPSARILVADERDMDSHNRQEFLARAAYNDWDAVILSHSAFKLIPVDPDFYEQFVEKELAQIDDLLSNADDLDKMTLKQVEKKRAALTERMKSMHDRVNGKRDQGLLHFGEIGFDYVVNDESHSHKNVPYMTTLKGVSGLGNPAGSERAEDMFIKVMQARESGAGVMFLTGTPISNTIAEMYLLMRYLGPEILNQQGVHSFDSWVSTFATVNEEFAFSLTGQFKSKKILSEFNDIPSLVQQYKSFSDIIGQQDIDRLLKAEGKKAIPLPKIKGGKPLIVTCPMSPEQRGIVGDEVGTNHIGEPVYSAGSILHRLDNLPSKPEKGEDNILVIINDLKKVSLDARAFDPEAPASETGKIPTCVENIVNTYQQWDADKGAQLVYLDFSTPKGSRGKVSPEVREILDLVARVEAGEDEEASDQVRNQAEAAEEKLSKYDPMEVQEAQRMAKGLKVWSAYEEIREQLMAKGIPEKEIAFIHDANTDQRKEELFGQVRSGAVRVLIGSTGKMGPGMNVQDRLVGIHHLDAPYRPSDVEQRNGRIIRQGNKLLEKHGKLDVDVMYYVTENSSDAGLWQILETKDKFINSIRFASGSRTASDPDAQAMDPAAVKAMASGHELLMTEVPLRARLKNLQRLESAYKNQSWVQRDIVKRARSRVADFDENRGRYSQDVTQAEQVSARIEQMRADSQSDKNDNTGPLFNWNGVQYSGKEITASLRIQIEQLFGYDARRKMELGHFEDFTFHATRSSKIEDVYLILSGESGLTYSGQEFAPKPGTDYVQRFVNLIRAIPNIYAKLERRYKQDQEDITVFGGLADKPFDRMDEMAVVQEQHSIAETLLRLRIRKWGEIAQTMEVLALTPDAINKATDMDGLEVDPHTNQPVDKAAFEERREQAKAELAKEAREKAQEYIDRARVAFSQPPISLQSIEILQHLGVSESDIEALKEQHGLVEEDEKPETVEDVEIDTPNEDARMAMADDTPDMDESEDLTAEGSTENVQNRPENAQDAMEHEVEGVPMQSDQKLPQEAVSGDSGTEDQPLIQTFRPTPQRPPLPRPEPVAGTTMDLFGDLFGAVPEKAESVRITDPESAAIPAISVAASPQKVSKRMKSVPDRLREFMATDQIVATEFGLQGTEHAFFEAKIRYLQGTLQIMPRSYDTDGQGDTAMVYLHYFTSSADWYMTELDVDKDGEGQLQAFGLADLGMGYPELGYINLKEAIRLGAELDYHFEPRSLQALKLERYPDLVHKRPDLPDDLQNDLGLLRPFMSAAQHDSVEATLRDGLMTQHPMIAATRTQVRWMQEDMPSPENAATQAGGARCRMTYVEDANVPTRWVFVTGMDLAAQKMFGAVVQRKTQDLPEAAYFTHLTMDDLPGHTLSLLTPAPFVLGDRLKSMGFALEGVTYRERQNQPEQAPIADTVLESLSVPDSLNALVTKEQGQQWAGIWESGTETDRDMLRMQMNRVAQWLDAPLPVMEAERQSRNARAGIVLRSEQGAIHWFITGLNADGVSAYGMETLHGEEAILGCVDLRVALQDAPIIVIEHEPGPLLADLREAGILIESVDFADDKRSVFYRGGPVTNIDRISSIESIFDYERNVLENDAVTMTPEGLEYQHLAPVSTLTWATTSRKEAEEYGKVREIVLNDPVVLMRDGNNGVLVAEQKSLAAALRNASPSPVLVEDSPSIQETVQRIEEKSSLTVEELIGRASSFIEPEIVDKARQPVRQEINTLIDARAAALDTALADQGWVKNHRESGVFSHADHHGLDVLMSTFQDKGGYAFGIQLQVQKSEEITAGVVYKEEIEHTIRDYMDMPAVNMVNTLLQKVVELEAHQSAVAATENPENPDKVVAIRPDSPDSEQENRWEKLHRIYENESEVLDESRIQLFDGYMEASDQDAVRNLQKQVRERKSQAILQVSRWQDTIVQTLGVPKSDPAFRKSSEGPEARKYLNALDALSKAEEQLIVLLRHDQLLDKGLADLWGFVADSSFDAIAKAGSWQAMQTPEFKEARADLLDSIINARAGMMASELKSSRWTWGGVSFTHTDMPGIKLFPNAEQKNGNNLSWGYRLTGPDGFVEVPDNFTHAPADFVRETLTMALNTPMQSRLDAPKETAQASPERLPEPAVNAVDLDAQVRDYIIQNHVDVVERAQRMDDFESFMASNIVMSVSMSLTGIMDNPESAPEMKAAAKAVLQGPQGMTDYRWHIGRVVFDAVKAAAAIEKNPEAESEIQFTKARIIPMRVGVIKSLLVRYSGQLIIPTRVGVMAIPDDPEKPVYLAGHGTIKANSLNDDISYGEVPENGEQGETQGVQHMDENENADLLGANDEDEGDFVDLDEEDSADLIEAAQPDVFIAPMDKPRMQVPDMFSTLNEMDLHPLFSNIHGVHPSGAIFKWEQDRHSAQVEINRTAMGEYTYRLSTQSSTGGMSGIGPDNMERQEWYPNLADTLQAGREHLVDMLLRDHRREAHDRKPQAARTLQRLVENVAGNPESDKQLVTDPEEENIPDTRGHMEALLKVQEDEPETVMALQWGAWREKPLVKATITRTEGQGMEARMVDDRGTVLNTAVVDPLDMLAWNRFLRGSVDALSLGMQRMVRNHPYGIGHEPQLEIRRPLRHAENLLPVPQWPANNAGELPVESGPFPLGNMDRYATRIWNTENGNRVTFAIGHGPDGYVSRLRVAQPLHFGISAPNIRLDRSHDSPVRATFAAAYADLVRAFKKQEKTEVSYAKLMLEDGGRTTQNEIYEDQLRLMDSVRKELDGQPGEIVSVRGGVDDALISRRDLEELTAVAVRPDFMQRSDFFQASHDTNKATESWILEGLRADGESFYLDTFGTWSRALQGVQTAMRHIAPQPAERSPDLEASATAVAEPTAERQMLPGTLQTLRMTLLPIISPTPVTEVATIGEQGVSGIYKGLDKTHSLICIDEQWYQHPLIDDWINSGIFSKSGWDSSREIFANASNWRGKPFSIQRGISDGEVTHGEPAWKVQVDGKYVNTHYENNLRRLQSVHRLAQQDAENLRDVGGQVTLDVRYRTVIESRFMASDQQALALEIDYLTDSENVNRHMKAWWIAADGKRVMDVQTDAESAKQPASWITRARDQFAEWSAQSGTIVAALEKLENLYHQSAANIGDALLAVPMAPVEDRETLASYRKATDAVYQSFDDEIRAQRKALGDLGLEWGHERIQAIEEREAWQAWRFATTQPATLQKEAEAQAIKETKNRGRRLLDMVSDTEQPEAMALAIFMKHGIETQGTPPIVQAVQTRNVERIQSIIGWNSMNPASQEVFERMTGGKLGSTQKARMAEIDAWGGITPEDRAQIDADKKAQKERQELVDEVTAIWNAFAGMSGFSSQTRQTITAQEMLLNMVQSGYTRIEMQEEPDSRGRMISHPALCKPEGGDGRLLKHKNFKRLLTLLVKGEFDPEHRFMESLQASGVLALPDNAAEQVAVPPVSDAVPDEPENPAEPPVKTDIFKTMKEMGIRHIRSAGDNEQWSSSGELPEGGTLHVYGSLDAGTQSIDIRGLPGKSPEAAYPVLRSLADAGFGDKLHTAEIRIEDSVLSSGVQVERNLVLSKSDMERVIQLQGHKPLEVLATITVDTETGNVAEIESAQSFLSGWKDRYEIPVAVTAIADPRNSGMDVAALKGYLDGLGVDHVTVLPVDHLKNSPVADMVRKSDLVMVLGEPMTQMMAVSAFIDKAFKGDHKDLNKPTCVIGADGHIEMHRDALLEVADRRAKYKHMDNDKMDRSIAAIDEKAIESATTNPTGVGETPIVQPSEQAELPALSPEAEVVTPILETPIAEQPEARAVEHEFDRVSPQENELANLPVESVARHPDEQGAQALPEPVMEPLQQVGDDLPEGMAAQDTEVVPMAEDWPAMDDTGVAAEIAATDEAERQQIVMDHLQALDWSALLADLSEQEKTATSPWDAAQCCAAAREYLKAQDPELWAEAIHFHFDVQDNPVQSPTITQRGGHDILGFADRAVVDVWAGMRLADKPFRFDFHDEKQLAYTAKLYGDPMRWEIVDLQVENQRGIALPQPTEAVSEREILMALDSIQRSPQWPRIDAADAERWLARAVDVATREKSALGVMLERDWIPVTPKHADAVMGRERLKFLVLHALYASGSQMKDTLSQAGQAAMLRRMLLQDLPMMPNTDTLRGTLHESAILAEVDDRKAGWTRVTQDYRLDLEEVLPEVIINWDALYIDSNQHYHLVDAKSPRGIPDAVDEGYVAQLNLYGEGLRRALEKQGIENPQIHLHLAFGSLADSLVKIVEVARDPEMANRMIETVISVSERAISGRKDAPALVPMDEAQRASVETYLEQYEARKVEADMLSDEIENLKKRMVHLQEGFEPVSWEDEHGDTLARMRFMAPPLLASNSDEWPRFAASARIDIEPYQRPEYDAAAMLEALREAGHDPAQFEIGKTLDLPALKTAIKASGGLPDVEWTWKVELAQTKVAKLHREVLKETLQGDRVERPGLAYADMDEHARVLPDSRTAEKPASPPVTADTSVDNGRSSAGSEDVPAGSPADGLKNTRPHNRKH